MGVNVILGFIALDYCLPLLFRSLLILPFSSTELNGLGYFAIDLGFIPPHILAVRAMNPPNNPRQGVWFSALRDRVDFYLYFCDYNCRFI